MIWHPTSIKLRVLVRTTVRKPTKVSDVCVRLSVCNWIGKYRDVCAVLERLSELGLVRRFRQPPGFRPLYQRLPAKELRARLTDLGWTGKGGKR